IIQRIIVATKRKCWQPHFPKRWIISLYWFICAMKMIGTHGQKRTATLNNLLYSDPTTRRKLVVCCAKFTTSLRRVVGPVSKALGNKEMQWQRNQGSTQ